MKLPAYLLAHGLSALDFARHAGVSRQAVDGLLRNGTASASVLLRIQTASGGEVTAADYGKGKR